MPVSPVMRIAVMQPYFLPYLGYFQLMRAADLWVVYDNVSFRKSSYIHRNRIWLGRHAGWFGLPVLDQSSHRPIMAHRTTLAPAARARLLRQVAHAYRGAPCLDNGLALAGAALPAGQLPLVDVLMTSLQACQRALGIDVPMLRASTLPIDWDLHGLARLLAICRHLGAHEYVNLSGGRVLYDAGDFSGSGIRLGFAVPALLPYPQAQAPRMPLVPFVPSLSILDLVMHVAPERRAAYARAGTIDWLDE